MTFTTDNTTFAQNVTQLLVTRGFAFKFYKTHGSPHGDFNFHVESDQVADVIRTMAADWGVSVYETHDDE